jgi:hypothetical protein
MTHEEFLARAEVAEEELSSMAVKHTPVTKGSRLRQIFQAVRRAYPYQDEDLYEPDWGFLAEVFYSIGEKEARTLIMVRLLQEIRNRQLKEIAERES